MLTKSRLVLETLEPLSGDRKCFRMINGVLTERTVKEVIPILKTNSDGLKKTLEELVKQYKLKQDEMEKWKVRPLVPNADMCADCIGSTEEEQRASRSTARTVEYEITNVLPMHVAYDSNAKYAQSSSHMAFATGHSSELVSDYEAVSSMTSENTYHPAPWPLTQRSYYPTFSQSDRVVRLHKKRSILRVMACTS
jgi:NurA-like 5'-3' nuclease